ncbi:acyl carrier protein [Porticoccaceae bacterium]|nr:acyl carrier protein [Porticoccaceae bacterium]
MTKDKLFDVMADVFQVNRGEITESWAPGTIKEWDSLKHMLLLMALEEEFEFRFTDDEMANCINVASILEILDEKVLETK